MVMFTVAGVNASDINDTVVASDETPNEDISVSDDETPNEDLSVSDDADVITDPFDKRTTMAYFQKTIYWLDDTCNFPHNYYYDENTDKDMVNGIVISKSMNINGWGRKIDAANKMRIFQVTNGATVTFKNII